MEASNRNFRYILRPILLHSIAKADNGAKKLPLGIIWCVILDTLCIYNKQNVTNYIGTKNTHNKYSCYGWQHQLWQLSFAVLVPGSLVALQHQKTTTTIVVLDLRALHWRLRPMKTAERQRTSERNDANKWNSQNWESKIGRGNIKREAVCVRENDRR